MSEWDERDIEQEEEYELPELSETEDPFPSEPVGSDAGDDSILSWPVMVGALLALIAGLGIYWLLSSRGPVTVSEEPEEAPVVERLEPEAPPEEPEPEMPEVVLPALAESDVFVREVLGVLSQHPELASFLVTEGLARKIVVAVVNIADGANASRQFRHLAPEAGFSVAQQRPRVFVNPQSYARYDALADGFASMDVEGLAQAYRDSKPLLDEAFSELGYPDKELDEYLARAITVLLQTPVVDRQIGLNAESVNYTYTDSKLESLSLPQKQLLRTGPANTRKVQKQLRAFADALGLGRL